MKLLQGSVKYYIALVVLLIITIFALPASAPTLHQYHITATQYHLLLFLVELPLAIIWFIALFGYERLRLYTRRIAGSREEEAYSYLTKGSKWLAIGLIVPSFVSLFFTAIANNHSALITTNKLLNNYMSLVFAFIAYTSVATGTQKLLKQSKLLIRTRDIQTMLLLFIVLGVVYCYFIFQSINIHSLTASNNAFLLPVWLLIVSFIMPYLYTWFIGLVAAYDLHRLATNTRGVLYRQAFRLFAYGYSLVIASSIGVQYLRSIMARSGHLSLNKTLGVVYIIYLLIGVGFVLISLGANKLKKIEEV